VNLQDNSIGFIGAGNMANSLIRGLLENGVPAGHLWAADVDADKLAQLESDCGINTAGSEDIAASVDVLVLAVKPQVMAVVCARIAASLAGRQCLVISIAAGITSEQLLNWLGSATAVVRCMPNTPALVGCGATALYATAATSPTQRQLAEAILSAVGLALWLEKEADMDAVTALSGSGPAYFFLFMEAMQDAALELGLDAETAHQLTCQTALGAARLAAVSESTTAELRRQVTSPGGTTEQALKQFEEGGLRRLVKQALQAARLRSQQLAEEFGKAK